MTSVLVTARGASSAAIWWPACARRASSTSVAWTGRPSTSGISASTMSTTGPPTSRSCSPAGAPVTGSTSCTTSPPTWAAWGSSRTTRRLCMLSVLINTHMLEAARASRGRALLLLLVGLRLRRRQAGVARRRAAARVRRLPGHARGRLRLGEALQRAHVPPLLRGLRPRDPRRPLPQRLRTARDLRRRPGEGPGRHLPQGRQAVLDGTERDRDLGRRQADAQLHLHRRLRGGHAAPDGQRRATSRSTSARDELVTINELVDIVEGIAGISLKRNYNLSAPQGVRGRNSDNTLIEDRLGWAPSVSLHDGLLDTYRWIFDEMSQLARVPVG